MFSSLAELDSNLDEVEATELANSNLLSVAPFGMDLDVHSNRSSVVAPVWLTAKDFCSKMCPQYNLTFPNYLYRAKT